MESTVLLKIQIPCLSMQKTLKVSKKETVYAAKRLVLEKTGIQDLNFGFFKDFFLDESLTFEKMENEVCLWIHG